MVQLSKAPDSPNKISEVQGASTATTSGMVEILKTPTGFLRVRSAPTTASTEVGQVHPHEKYKYLGTDKDTGWIQISLEATQSGWVTNQYAAITPP